MTNKPTDPAPAVDGEMCPVCGAEIPPGAPEGMCPACLLNAETMVSPPSSKPKPKPESKPPATTPGETATDPSGEPQSPSPSPSASPPPQAPALDPRFAVPLEKLRELFPDLEILDLLGAGGMGAVYRARQPRLDRTVALKVLTCPPEMHDDFSLRFEREAQVLARLNHPNIVTIYDFGEIDRTGDPDSHGNLFYFVMEFVNGADLNQLIRTGELKPEQALKIVPQICDALQYAHDEGITHRDIKPANILVGKKGRVRIADFGLAKLIGAESDALGTGLTLTGTSMGTPHYMAPEQWETMSEVDHRADIYSLGVVFYEMLTGDRPHGIFDPPSRKIEVDVRLDEVVLKAMEKDIDRRYQQASEVKDDVTRVTTTPTMAAVPTPRTQKQGKATVMTALLGIILAALLGGGAWWWLNRPDVEGEPVAEVSNVEPASGNTTRAPKLNAPPVLTAMRERGGQLRGWVSGDEEIIGLDLAEGIDDFVRLDGIVYPGSDRWLAIRADGPSVTPLADFERSGELVSLDTHLGVLNTGEIVNCYKDGTRRVLPGDAIDSGYGGNSSIQFELFLNRDGTVALNRAPSGDWLDEEIPRTRELLHGVSDAVKIEANGSAMGMVLRESGEVIAWSPDDLWSSDIEITDAVDAALGAYWSATLRADGSVHFQTMVGEDSRFAKNAPSDLDPAYAVRSDGYVGAAQMADGSWRAWGDDQGTGLIDQIESIGPAADIRFHHKAGKGDTALLWIEPGQSTDAALVKPSPLFTYAEPGQLKGWSRNETGEPFLDLTHAEGIDDFVQVGVWGERWAALRENGSLIYNDRGEIAQNVRAITSRSSEWYLTNDGFLKNMTQGKPVIKVPEQIRDVAVGSDWGSDYFSILMVDEGGTVRFQAAPQSGFTPQPDELEVYESSNWRNPPEIARNGAVRVLMTDHVSMVEKEDGSCVFWSHDQKPLLSPEGTVSTAIVSGSPFALLANGSVMSPGALDLGKFEWAEVARLDQAKQVWAVGELLFQMRDGSYRTIKPDVPIGKEIESALEQIVGLSPAAWDFAAHPKAGKARDELRVGNLLWIEPNSEGEASPPPLASRAEPGRLRAWSASSSNEAVFDLSPGEKFQDFVTVVMREPGLWIALRANGDLIDSEDGKIASGVRSIVTPGEIQTSKARAYVTEDDRLVALRINDDLGPDPIKIPRVRDLAVAADGKDRQVYLVLENGDLEYRCWGTGQNDAHENPDRRWRLPPESAMTGISEVATNHMIVTVKREDGSFAAWSTHGIIDVPGDIISLTTRHNRLIGAKASGEVFSLSVGETTEWERSETIDGSSTKGIAHVLGGGDFPLFETADGRRIMDPRDFGGRPFLKEFEAALDKYRGEDFAWFLQQNGNGFSGGMLWIEPGGIEANTKSPERTGDPENFLLTGKLTAYGSSVEGTAIDLSAAEGIDDFAQVVLQARAWMGLRENGETISSTGRDNESGVRRLFPLGGNHFAFEKRDGGLQFVSGGTKPREFSIGENVPDDISRVGLADFSGGELHAIALLTDGSARVWGDVYDHPDRLPAWMGVKTAWPRPPAEALTGVRSIGSGGDNTWAGTVTGDGRLWLWNEQGLIDLGAGEDLQGQFAEIRSANSGAFDVLLGDGRALLVNLETGMHRIDNRKHEGDSAALTYGGYRSIYRSGKGGWYSRWVVPGLSEFLEPVKGRDGTDFSLFTMFQGYEGGGEKVSMGLIAIDPPQSEAESESAAPAERPQLDVPAALAAMRERGGRLRAWASEGAELPPGLELAEGIDDFVRLDGIVYPGSDRWLAVRADGPSVTPLADFERSGELVSLDTHLGVLKTGEIVECYGDHSRKIKPGDAVDSGYAGHGIQFELFLNRDGTVDLNRAFPKGQWFDEGFAGTLQLLGEVKDAVKIDTGPSKGIVLRESGEVIAWKDDGRWAPDPDIAEVIDIAMAGNFWAAVRADGSVHVEGGGATVPPGLPPAFAIRAPKTVVAAQLADGSWRAWGNDKGSGLIDQIEAIGPAVDLLFFSDNSAEKCTLLWIEPATDGRAAGAKP